MNKYLYCLPIICLPMLALGQEQEMARDPNKLVFRASLLAGVSNSPNFDESNDRHYFKPQGAYLGLTFSLGKENIGLSASYFANSFSYSESKIESVYPNYSKRDQHSKVKSSGVFLGPYFGSASGGKKRIYVEASAGFGFVSENQEGKNIQSVTGYIDREDEHLMTTAYLFRGQIRYSFARLGLSAGIGTDFIYFADYENDNAGVVTSNFFGVIMLPF